MAYGMDENTGKKITGTALLQQQISRAILTPVNSSILNRDFGSLTTEMIDQPGNQANLLKLYSSVADAILKFVKNIVPIRIQAKKSDFANGEFSIEISGVVTQNIDDLTAGSPINLTIPLLSNI